MYRHRATSVIAGLLLTGAAAFAGSFTSDFGNPSQTGFTINGTGTLSDGNSWWPGIEGGLLKLTVNQNSLGGSFNLDDLDAGSPIESFDAAFKLQFGPGSGNPADGASFVFGPDVNANSMFNEDGPVPGTSLTVAFDTYDNGGGEAPGVDVLLFGTPIAHHAFAKADMITSKLEDVAIQLKRNGTLTVSYKGQKIYDNLVLPGWAPTAGQFGLNARTGGENANTFVDDLRVTTVVAKPDVAPTVTTQPQSVAVAEGASASFTVAFDGTAPISLQWTKNGADILDATNATLVLIAAPAADNGAKIACKVTNNAGSVTSQDAILTVSSDK